MSRIICAGQILGYKCFFYKYTVTFISLRIIKEIYFILDENYLRYARTSLTWPNKIYVIC